MRGFGEFLHDETGAVTIDWVALTSGMLLLGITVVYAIFNSGVGASVGNINATLAGISTALNLGAAPALNGTGESGTSTGKPGGGDTICLTLADGSVICSAL